MRLFFITSNKGKFDEVAELLNDIDNLEIEQLEIKYPEIQAETLEEVAKFSAQWFQDHLDLWGNADTVMLEDSGLFIERLKGFPGVYSAYAHKTIGLRSILELMEGEWDRRAYFETCLCMVKKDDEPKYFSGICNGNISKEARGEHGFGYDPIFTPEGETRVFAEMSTEEKNKFSHRSKAANKLKSFLKNL
jgi:XTP/dITP diphosphohydrolase